MSANSAKSAVTRGQALRLELIEQAAWRDVHAAALPRDRDELALRSRDLADAFVMSSDREESLLANRVIGLGLIEPVTGETLDALVEHYRGRASGFAINLSPFAEPTSLAEPLAERGFATFFHHLKWWRDDAAHEAPATEVRIRRATRADMATWTRMAVQLFDWSLNHAVWSSRLIGREGWWHGFAEHRGVPMGLAAVFVQGDAAWLGFAGTLTQHRRMGAHGALLAARIAHARAEGARVMTLETAPDWPDIPGESLRNAARAGFHPAYERPSWIWPAR